MRTKNEKETFAAAFEFGARLSGGETLYLYGDVGAGKTVFVKGLAAGLGVTETVTSPTFVYMNTYQSGRAPLTHFDLYRVSGREAAAALGLLEALSGAGVKAVEWPEILGEDPSVVKIHIDKIGARQREIRIENFNRNTR